MNHTTLHLYPLCLKSTRPLLLNPFHTTRCYKHFHNKGKFKGLDRKSSELAGFSIFFFMVLRKSSISWLKKKKKKSYLKFFSLSIKTKVASYKIS